MENLDLDPTAEDAIKIDAIVDRAKKLDRRLEPLTVALDVTATHLNGCPLDLDGLLDGNVADFMHDIYGISRYIDRHTGKLTGTFHPRYAKNQ